MASFLKSVFFGYFTSKNDEPVDLPSDFEQNTEDKASDSHSDESMEEKHQEELPPFKGFFRPFTPVEVDGKLGSPSQPPLLIEPFAPVTSTGPSYQTETTISEEFERKEAARRDRIKREIEFMSLVVEPEENGTWCGLVWPYGRSMLFNAGDSDFVVGIPSISDPIPFGRDSRIIERRPTKEEWEEDEELETESILFDRPKKNPPKRKRDEREDILQARANRLFYTNIDEEAYKNCVSTFSKEDFDSDGMGNDDDWMDMDLKFFGSSRRPKIQKLEKEDSPAQADRSFLSLTWGLAKRILFSRLS